MKTIYKYSGRISDEVIFEMPKGAEILTAGVQTGMFCIWALVDTTIIERVLRTICIRGTGHPLKGNEGEFINTFFVDGGLVFHAFEQKP